MKKSLTLRSLAALTVLSFIATNVTYQPLLSAAPVMDAGQLVSSFPSELSKIEFPKNLGRVEDSFKGTSDQLVIVVQDAHAIPEAQKSIQKIIEHFQSQYGLNLIGLEGASSQLDSRMFKSYPDKDAMQKVFQGYYEKGELTGSVAAAIFSEKPSVYEGVEDWGLYEKGLELYLTAMKNQSKLLSELEIREKNLRAQKENNYSKELLEVDRSLDGFLKNGMELPNILKLLAQYQKPKAGSELAAMLEEVSKEKEDTSLDLEVKRLIPQFEKQLKAGEQNKSRGIITREFQSKHQDFQTSRVSAQEFALWMKETASKEGMALRTSGRLGKQMGKQKMLRDIEGTKFFKDFETYAESVKKGLFKGPEDSKLNKESKRLEVLRKLVQLELTREEWEKLQSAAKNPQIGMEKILGVKAEAVASHFNFYENATARDQAFLKNLKKINRSNQKASLLVAGGFHAYGLTEHLKAAGISHLLILPEMGSVPEETNYKDQMIGNVSWKDYFEVENGRVNLYKAFVRGTRDKLLGVKKEGSEVPAAAKKVLKYWRDQIIRDLSDQKQIEKSGDYTRFLDEVVKEKGMDNSSGPIAKIDHFIDGLKNLKITGRLTEQNIMNLAKTVTFAPVVTGAVGQTNATVPASDLGMGITGVSETEPRVEISVPKEAGRAESQPAFLKVLPATQTQIRKVFSDLQISAAEDIRSAYAEKMSLKRYESFISGQAQKVGVTVEKHSKGWAEFNLNSLAAARSNFLTFLRSLFSGRLISAFWAFYNAVGWTGGVIFQLSVPYQQENYSKDASQKFEKILYSETFTIYPTAVLSITAYFAFLLGAPMLTSLAIAAVIFSALWAGSHIFGRFIPGARGHELSHAYQSILIERIRQELNLKLGLKIPAREIQRSFASAERERQLMSFPVIGILAPSAKRLEKIEREILQNVEKWVAKQAIPAAARAENREEIASVVIAFDRNNLTFERDGKQERILEDEMQISRPVFQQIKDLIKKNIQDKETAAAILGKLEQTSGIRIATWGEGEGLGIVLRELLVNSFRSIRENNPDVKGKVEIQVVLEEGVLKLLIKDDGKGFVDADGKVLAPEQIETIFEEGSTSKTGFQVKMGLVGNGLYRSRFVIEKGSFQGKLSAYNRPAGEKGAVFEIAIPLQARSESRVDGKVWAEFSARRQSELSNLATAFEGEYSIQIEDVSADHVRVSVKVPAIKDSPAFDVSKNVSLNDGDYQKFIERFMYDLSNFGEGGMGMSPEATAKKNLRNFGKNLQTRSEKREDSAGKSRFERFQTEKLPGILKRVNPLMIASEVIMALFFPLSIGILILIAAGTLHGEEMKHVLHGLEWSLNPLFLSHAAGAFLKSLSLNKKERILRRFVGPFEVILAVSLILFFPRVSEIVRTQLLDFHGDLMMASQEAKTRRRTYQYWAGLSAFAAVATGFVYFAFGYPAFILAVSAMFWGLSATFGVLKEWGEHRAEKILHVIEGADETETPGKPSVEKKGREALTPQEKKKLGLIRVSKKRKNFMDILAEYNKKIKQNPDLKLLVFNRHLRSAHNQWEFVHGTGVFSPPTLGGELQAEALAQHVKDSGVDFQRRFSSNSERTWKAIQLLGDVEIEPAIGEIPLFPFGGVKREHANEALTGMFERFAADPVKFQIPGVFNGEEKDAELTRFLDTLKHGKESRVLMSTHGIVQNWILMKMLGINTNKFYEANRALGRSANGEMGHASTASLSAVFYDPRTDTAELKLYGDNSYQPKALKDQPAKKYKASRVWGNWFHYFMLLSIRSFEYFLWKAPVAGQILKTKNPEREKLIDYFPSLLDWWRLFFSESKDVLNGEYRLVMAKKNITGHLSDQDLFSAMSLLLHFAELPGEDLSPYRSLILKTEIDLGLLLEEIVAKRLEISRDRNLLRPYIEKIMPGIKNSKFTEKGRTVLEEKLWEQVQVPETVSAARAEGRTAPSETVSWQEIEDGISDFEQILSTIVPGDPNGFQWLYRSPEAQSKKDSNVGIFPTSANPFHLDHARIVETIMNEKNLDEVVIMVSPHHVTKTPLSAKELAIRVAMIREAFRDNPKVSIAVSGLSRYSAFVENVSEALAPKSLNLMMGMDNLESWLSQTVAEERESLIGKSNVLVNTRLGMGQEEFERLLTQFGVPESWVKSQKVKYVPISQDNISSTSIRERQPGWEQKVAEGVAQIIEKYDLFKPSAELETAVSGIRSENREEQPAIQREKFKITAEDLTDAKVDELISSLTMEGYFQPLRALQKNPVYQNRLREVMRAIVLKNGGYGIYKPGEVILGPNDWIFSHYKHRGDNKYHLVISGKAMLRSMGSYIDKTGEENSPEEKGHLRRFKSEVTFSRGMGFAARAAAEEVGHWGEIIAEDQVMTLPMDSTQFAELIKLLADFDLEKPRNGMTPVDESEVLKAVGSRLAFGYGGMNLAKDADGKDQLTTNLYRIRREVEVKKDKKIPQEVKDGDLAKQLRAGDFLYKDPKTGQWFMITSEIQAKIKRSSENQFLFQGNIGGDGKSLNYMEDTPQLKGGTNAVLLGVSQNTVEVPEAYEPGRLDSGTGLSIRYIDSPGNDIFFVETDYVLKKTAEWTESGEKKRAIRAEDEHNIWSSSVKPGSGKELTPGAENAHIKIFVTFTSNGTSVQQELPLPLNGVIDPAEIISKIKQDGQGLQDAVFQSLTIATPPAWKVRRLSVKDYFDQIDETADYSISDFINEAIREGYILEGNEKERLEAVIRGVEEEYRLSNRLGHSDLTKTFRLKIFNAISQWVLFDKLPRIGADSQPLDTLQVAMLTQEYMEHMNDEALPEYNDVQKGLLLKYGNSEQTGILTDWEALDQRLRRMWEILKGVEKDFGKLAGDEKGAVELHRKTQRIWQVLRALTDGQLDGSADWMGIKHLLLQGLDDVDQALTGTLSRPLTDFDLSQVKGLAPETVLIPDIHEGRRELFEWARAVGLIDKEGNIIYSPGRVIIQQGDIVNRFVSDNGLALLSDFLNWMEQINALNEKHPDNAKMELRILLGNHELDILHWSVEKQAEVAGQLGEYRVRETRRRLMEMIRSGQVVVRDYLGDPKDADNPMAGIQLNHSVLPPSVKKLLLQEMNTRKLDEKEYPRNSYGVTKYMNLVFRESLPDKAEFDGLEVLKFDHFMFAKSKRRVYDGKGPEQSGPIEFDASSWRGNDLFFELVGLGIFRQMVDFKKQDGTVESVDINTLNRQDLGKYFSQFKNPEELFAANIAPGITVEKAQEIAAREFGIQIVGHSFDSDDHQGVRMMEMLGIVFKNVLIDDGGRRQVGDLQSNENRTTGVVIMGGTAYQVFPEVRPLTEAEKPLTEREVQQIQAGKKDDRRTAGTQAFTPFLQQDLSEMQNSFFVNQRLERGLSPNPNHSIIPSRDLMVLAKEGTLIKIEAGKQMPKGGDYILALSGTFELRDIMTGNVI